MNIIRAVRENIRAAITEQLAEIAKAESTLEALRDELHLLEDIRSAARVPDYEFDETEEPAQVAA